MAPSLLGHVKTDPYLSSGLLTKPQIQVYGFFSDQQLFASVAINLWVGLPYFSFLKLVVSKNNLKKSQQMFFYRTLATFILTEMLKQNRTSFFYSMKKSHFYKGNFEVSEHSWTKKNIPIFNLFQFNFESFYNGQELSPYPTINSFFGYPQNKPMLLRRGTIKPHIFKEIYLDKIAIEDVIRKHSSADF